MSPARSDDPLRRTTLNLYAADCAYLEKTVGQGWTELIRQLVHAEVQHRVTSSRPVLITVADLQTRSDRIGDYDE
jgi:hypothetical protein